MLEAELRQDGEVQGQDGGSRGSLNHPFRNARGDYGIHQLYWNGEKLGDPIDFYDDSLQWKQVKLGKVRVTGGKAVLTAECVGANAKAIPRRMFGLDYLLMKKL